ncbi:hypothetical protein BC938DRAFT_474935 [Jimgerdemannia flammicorona]|uniref:Uncharacterized protein n=1 Tax=Jimgerdemannia flammicorona TaxID=994334 RepID=A0A433Q183_9FUNG|nr:hypothetical protein BC938DRAFT_474935 [Jimgerdemannia flammicorona]
MESVRIAIYSCPKASDIIIIRTKLGQLLLLTLAIDGEGDDVRTDVKVKEYALIVGDILLNKLIHVEGKFASTSPTHHPPSTISESKTRRLEPTLGGGEVDDIAVLLEHIHLLDTDDGLNVQLFEGGLKLLVVGG